MVLKWCSLEGPGLHEEAGGEATRGLQSLTLQPTHLHTRQFWKLGFHRRLDMEKNVSVLKI